MIRNSVLAIGLIGLVMMLPFDSVGESGAAGRAAAAAIRATARVETTGGMAPAEAILADRIESGDRIERASHLFWLYYPRTGQLQIELSRPNELPRLVSAERDDDGPLYRRVQHDYASLVNLDRQVSGDDPVTITLIYPDI